MNHDQTDSTVRTAAFPSSRSCAVREADEEAMWPIVSCALSAGPSPRGDVRGERYDRAVASQRVPHLTAKLQGFGTTIFAEMTSLAAQTGSINLGQGFPDTDGPRPVLDAAID